MAILPSRNAPTVTSIQAPAGNGLLCLRAIIDRSAGAEFRNISAELFLSAERPYYDFIRAFYQQHGQLPTLDVMAAENLRLLHAATSPVSYYTTKLYERAQYNAFIAAQPAIVAAIQTKNMEAATAHLRDLHVSVSHYTADQDTFTIQESIAGVMEAYQQARLHPGIQGITIGWPALDTTTGGMEAGDVITLVGRPGEGKSWLLTYCARQARLSGKSVLFISNEMMHTSIARRYLGLQSGVNPDFIRRGEVDTWGEEALYAGVEASNAGPAFHLVSGSFKKTTDAVEAAIIEFSPDVVYIDASYLMKPAAKNSKYAKHELLSVVGEDIKTIAMRRNKPIMQSVQFNRAAKKEKDGTKDLSNIGGTDTIAQISTGVISLAPGDGGDMFTTRKLSLLKNREGGAVCDLNIRFLFSPPDFSTIESASTTATADPAGGGQLSPDRISEEFI